MCQRHEYLIMLLRILPIIDQPPILIETPPCDDEKFKTF